MFRGQGPGDHLDMGITELREVDDSLKTDQPGERVPTHSDEVFEAHERILGASPVRSPYIEVPEVDASM